MKSLKLNLPAKFQSYISSVLGQLSDGWGENNRRWEIIWQNVGTSTSDDGKTVVNVNGPLEWDYRWTDVDSVKEFFANNIKKTAQMALKDNYGRYGKWDRSNTKMIWGYLDGTLKNEHGYACWNVQEAYFVYEMLKGRDVKKHPEYRKILAELAEEEKSRINDALGSLMSITQRFQKVC